MMKMPLPAHEAEQRAPDGTLEIDHDADEGFQAIHIDEHGTVAQVDRTPTTSFSDEPMKDEPDEPQDMFDAPAPPVIPPLPDPEPSQPPEPEKTEPAPMDFSSDFLDSPYSSMPAQEPQLSELTPSGPISDPNINKLSQASTPPPQYEPVTEPAPEPKDDEPTPPAPETVLTPTKKPGPEAPKIPPPSPTAKTPAPVATPAPTTPPVPSLPPAPQLDPLPNVSKPAPPEPTPVTPPAVPPPEPKLPATPPPPSVKTEDKASEGHVDTTPKEQHDDAKVDHTHRLLTKEKQADEIDVAKPSTDTPIMNHGHKTLQPISDEFKKKEVQNPIAPPPLPAKKEEEHPNELHDRLDEIRQSIAGSAKNKLTPQQNIGAQHVDLDKKIEKDEAELKKKLDAAKPPEPPKQPPHAPAANGVKPQPLVHAEGQKGADGKPPAVPPPMMPPNGAPGGPQFYDADGKPMNPLSQ